LQFFPNQAQFANDLLRDLVFQNFTSLSRNTIAFTAGSSIVLVAPVVHKNCVRERIRVNATLLHCDLLTGRGREGKLANTTIDGEYNLSGQELPLSIMRLYLPRTGRFDSVVAKLKIEIIFFDGQRARLKSGLTKVSPMSPGRTMGFEPTTSSLRTRKNLR
jgi:hypothetical protein